MNLFTLQSQVKIDNRIITATLIQSVFLEQLERHVQDLEALIPDQNFFFECLGKMTVAYLRGYSCLIFIQKTIKEIHIIENINVWKAENGLYVNFDSHQSLWNFKTESQQRLWEDQLLLIQKSLDKPCIPSKEIKSHQISPPRTPDRQSQLRSRTSLQSLKTRLWFPFKSKKQELEILDLESEEMEEELTLQDFQRLVLESQNEHLSLDLDNDSDIFSDFKNLL